MPLVPTAASCEQYIYLSNCPEHVMTHENTQVISERMKECAPHVGFGAMEECVRHIDVDGQRGVNTPGS